MSGLLVEVGEIPEVIVSTLALGNLVVRLRLDGMDKIGELD